MAGGAGALEAVAVWVVVIWEVDAMVRIAGVWQMARSSGDGCGESESDSPSLSVLSVFGSSSSGPGSGKRIVAVWLVTGSVSETSCVATSGVGGPK